MAVTPQTNTDLGAIAEALRSRDDFIICGHVSLTATAWLHTGTL